MMRVIPSSVLIIFLLLIQLVKTQVVDVTTTTSSSTSTLSSSSTSTSSTSSSSSSSSSTVTAEATSVWMTLTLDNGAITTTVFTAYSQQFSQMYSSFSVPASGSIGLGTISGTIGVVKPTASEESNGAGRTMTDANSHVGFVACMIAMLVAGITGYGGFFML
ncbi:hypothetical protein V1514DRAFT_352210 [Lipomyces japonicus]|uniref:uncharacterized protein n=1 Tax=Lipomyces japonicus TaxID=56871 RepID=UPI0034CFE8F0